MAIRECLIKGKKCFEVYVNGFDSGGRRVQRRKTRVETKSKAEKIEFEFKRELAQLKEQRVQFKWHEWFEICIKRMKTIHRPSTVLNYDGRLKRWIHPHWANVELGSITRQMVHEVIFDRIGDGLSEHSRLAVLKMVRRIFQMAVDEGLIDRNPGIGIQVRVAETDQKVLTNTEAGIFLKQAQILNHRFYPTWAVALMTGMRSGELYALKWTDIDFEMKTIAVTKQWTNKSGIGPTKTQKSRVVPVSDDLLGFLKELKLKSGSRDEVLPFLKEWEHGEQARVTREFCQSLGITPVKFHDLRATFITNLLARGESLAKVMAMVGHSQLKTTNGYLRKAGVDVQGGTEKLGYSLPKETSAKVLELLRV